MTDSTFLREYNLVSPFSNIIGGYKYNNIIHDVYQMNCNAIEYIRKLTPEIFKILRIDMINEYKENGYVILR